VRPFFDKPWLLMRISLTALVLCFCMLGCRSKNTLFTAVDPEDSGIRFANNIQESQTLSVLNYEYIYNGGGVGIGDFNNDSLPDIYFTGNMVPNQLYLNKGDFQFEDITESAGVNGGGKWCKGVSVVDINNDGWQDLYVCAAVKEDSNARRNLLYVNQGVSQGNSKPVFKEMAAEYGLDDASNTHMAAFFDYDNDGDLDVYLLLNDLDGTYPNEFRPIRKDGSWPNTDKLLQNNWDSTKQHAVFKDVSAQAGILIEGHGLGVAVADINQDGWKDIYVSNDYISNNILYINNGNGTFTDRCAEYLKHSSKNAMGNDVADINNDGLPDIIETDMAPADNYRLKMMYSDISYQAFQNSERFGYMEQYPRNMLHLNQGQSFGENDSASHPVFSEIAYMAGIAQTDWSWAPLLVDADNDGYRDLFISNGLPKDMTDLDFMAYRKQPVAATPIDQVLSQLPTLKVSNYAFRNNGDATFTNLTNEWGWEQPTFSAGMAYADFDRDGDMDMVINNTNMQASLLKNNAQEKKETAGHFLKVAFKGNDQNKNGFGTVVKVYANGQQQVAEHTPYRGYMSSIEPTVHFGLGNATKVDSVVVIWFNGKVKTIRQPAVDATLIVDFRDAVENATWSLAERPLFTDITSSTGIKHFYKEVEFIDFNIQRLIPHKFSQYGPSMAVGDINGDGLDDLIIGGGSPFFATVCMQQSNGKFATKPLVVSDEIKYQDDGGLCLLDAEGDGDLDLYVASGGGENEPQSKAYADHFYENDGKGNFKELVLPVCNNRATKGAVRAADYDNDGDLDLFVAGRFIPGRYPMPASSFLYRNDSKPGAISFTDVTNNTAPELLQVGMVTDALWTDINNDNQPDLLLSTEWGPLIAFQNQNGTFKKVTTGLEKQTGWWNSLAAGDFDNDGDIDFVAGNAGRNLFMQASEKTPVSIYGFDFDNNTSFDAVMSCFLLDSLDGKVREFPVTGRDEFIKEMTAMKERYPNYRSYARTEVSQLFPAGVLEQATALKATQFNSCFIENKGGFKMELHVLPLAAQMAPVYGIGITDVNADGNLDLLLNGNEFGMAPYLGRSDAMNGLLFLGDGKGKFQPISMQQSGWYIPGNGKSLANIMVGDQPYWMAGQNLGITKVFRQRAAATKGIRLLPADRYALLRLKNGKTRKQEWYGGNGFLSQPGQYVWSNESVGSIEITNRQGKKRMEKP
jgi:hypothetical protein